MDIEKIREILATKGMGWVWNEFEGFEMWGTPSHGGIKLECWLDKWKPDENPEQMMDVANMMRGKGWILSLEGWGSMRGDVQWGTRWYADYTKGDRCDGTYQRHEAVVSGDTFCPAVAEAAALALGMEEETDELLQI